jgi:hypothetical protein
MTYLCFYLMDLNPAVIGAMIPVVGAIVLFGIFLPVAVWTGHRKEEREAFYKSETLRRIAESSGEGARAAIELMKQEADARAQEAHARRLRKREDTKLGGVILIGVGIGITLLMGGKGGNYALGLIPCLIGAAMLVYVYFMAAPIEPCDDHELDSSHEQ